MNVIRNVYSLIICTILMCVMIKNVKSLNAIAILLSETDLSTSEEPPDPKQIEMVLPKFRSIRNKECTLVANESIKAQVWGRPRYVPLPGIHLSILKEDLRMWKLKCKTPEVFYVRKYPGHSKGYFLFLEQFIEDATDDLLKGVNCTVRVEEFVFPDKVNSVDEVAAIKSYTKGAFTDKQLIGIMNEIIGPRN